MQGQPCVAEPFQAVARRHGQASRTRGIGEWRRGCRGSHASPSPNRLRPRVRPPPPPNFKVGFGLPEALGGPLFWSSHACAAECLGPTLKLGGRGGRASRVPLFCPSTVVVNVALLVASWPKPRLGAKHVVGIYDNAFLYSVLPRWPMDNALMLVLPNCRRNLPQSESDWGRFSPTV